MIKSACPHASCALCREDVDVTYSRAWDGNALDSGLTGRVRRTRPRWEDHPAPEALRDGLENAPAEAHMPSGVEGSTNDIYEVTEARKQDEPLAVQLLHLAAHVINMPTLMELRIQHGLLLDRCGWSTLAYGGFGGGMERVGVSPSTFTDLVHEIWSQLKPDVGFSLIGRSISMSPTPRSSSVPTESWPTRQEAFV